MNYRVTHVTTYEASERVSVCHNVAKLKPRQTRYQSCARHKLVISPTASRRTTSEDSFGNSSTYFSSCTGYLKLTATSSSTVAVSDPQFDTLSDSPEWESVLLPQLKHELTNNVTLDATQYLFESPRVHTDPAFRDYARQSFLSGRPIVDALNELTHRVNVDFEYNSQATTVSTPVHDVFEHRHGVCQDFAHVQIAMLRSLGIPARYVSGYIRTYTADGGERLVGAAASHAWLSVFVGDRSIGDAGWVDADPTNDKLLTDEYITLAWGRDYSDVTPLRGVYTGGGHHELLVAVDVEPLD